MTGAQRQIKLGAFLYPTGHHIAAWWHPEAQPNAGSNFRLRDFGDLVLPELRRRRLFRSEYMGVILRQNLGRGMPRHPARAPVAAE